MRLSSTKMLDRKMLFAAIPSICASSPKKISIYNEEMIVARCFIGFLIFSRKSLGQTFKVTLDGRIQSIQEESQQFPNPNEVVPSESNEQQRLLRISLRICGTVVESLPTARSAPKCEKTVQALLCRNLNVKSATLLNATSSRRIRLQDDIVTGFHFSVLLERKLHPQPEPSLEQPLPRVGSSLSISLSSGTLFAALSGGLFKSTSILEASLPPTCASFCSAASPTSEKVGVGTLTSSKLVGYLTSLVAAMASKRETS
ncbi:hypothetical protein M5K25_028198 [Dendrobium thyrsiflorum]|uniref:ATP synthase protein MI25 n=1 Tax=Dendrobium thyrsiflorum TaxID=117978 RepID=A0ABD0TTZ1_DENTH